MDSENQKPTKPQLWKKGQSGNLKGRPKKIYTLRTCLHELENTVVPGDSQHRSRAQLLAEVLWAKALRNDKQAVLWAKLLLDYMIGRPVPITEMPQVVINNNQNVITQESSYDHLTIVLQALTKAGILPPELFAKFASPQTNGHVNGEDLS